jgi:hypothetical protein
VIATACHCPTSGGNGASPASNPNPSSKPAFEAIEIEDSPESPAREGAPVEIESNEWPCGSESIFNFPIERRLDVGLDSALSKLRIWNAAVAEILSLDAAVSASYVSHPKKRVEIVIISKEDELRSFKCVGVQGEDVV